MKLQEYITNDFEPFAKNTSIKAVKQFFRNTTFSHFPIVEAERLLGLISETEIQGIDEEIVCTLDEVTYMFQLFTTSKEENLLEVLNTFATNETNILPVLDDEMNYVGYLDLFEVLYFYHNTPFLQEQGEILTVQKATKDISFSEVSQLVESNKGKLLAIFKSEIKEGETVITVKFTGANVNEILQSFRRYDYKIITTHKKDFYLEDLKERSNYLQKYLNI